jgi:dTDP-4-dehydrorhamnose 3,5-epimerase
MPHPSAPPQRSTLNSQLGLIPGGQHADERGTVSFVNEFDFKGVDRFYWVTAGEVNVLRGWVGHRREQKWFTVAQGEVLVAVVRPDDWERPSQDLPVARYLLSAAHPQVLHKPPGHATASVNLNKEAVLLVFSSGKIEAAKSDDFRFPVDYWPIRA